MCSQAMVFLLSFSLISLASEEMRVINSTQHSIRRSRASLPKARPEEGGRISVTIFWTVAVKEPVSISVLHVASLVPNFSISDELPGGELVSGYGLGMIKIVRSWCKVRAKFDANTRWRTKKRQTYLWVEISHHFLKSSRYVSHHPLQQTT